MKLFENEIKGRILKKPSFWQTMFCSHKYVRMLKSYSTSIPFHEDYFIPINTAWIVFHVANAIHRFEIRIVGTRVRKGTIVKQSIIYWNATLMFSNVPIQNRQIALQRRWKKEDKFLGMNKCQVVHLWAAETKNLLQLYMCGCKNCQDLLHLQFALVFLRVSIGELLLVTSHHLIALVTPKFWYQVGRRFERLQEILLCDLWNPLKAIVPDVGNRMQKSSPIANHTLQQVSTESSSFLFFQNTSRSASLRSL